MTERLRHAPRAADLIHCITERSPWGQIVLDDQQRVVLWNAWIENASEVPAAIALGTRLDEVFPELPQRLTTVVDDNLRTGMSSVLSRAFQPHPFPLRNRQFRDRPMFQSVTISGFRGDDGHRYCLINILDASKEAQREGILKQRTADLERSKAALEEANHNLEMFTHMVGHDLRAPVRRICTFVRHLAADLGDETSEQVGLDMDNITRSARRLSELIDAIYRLAYADRLDLEIERFPLGDVLHPVIELLREAGSWRDAVATHDALPVVRADRSLLERLFQNLLDNALKYAGDAPARIHVTVEESQDEVVVGVRDHGIGVDVTEAERLVGPFERALESADIDGLGIGLAICRRVVERHQGRLWFEPVDVGTHVRFSLPHAVVSKPSR